MALSRVDYPGLEDPILPYPHGWQLKWRDGKNWELIGFLSSPSITLSFQPFIHHRFWLPFYCCDRTLWPKATKGQKHFLGLHSLSLKWRAKTQARIWNRNRRGMLLADLMAGLSLISFLLCPRTICLGNVATYSGLPPHTSSNNQDNPPQICPQAIWSCSPSIETPFSGDWLGCAKLMV